MFDLVWLLLLVVVLLLSLIITGKVRRYAIESGMQDAPNERSSHLVATPRGGGLALVIAFLSGVLIASYFQMINTDLSYALTGAGLLVAGIGFMDDHGHIHPVLRLVVHIAGAIWAIYWLDIDKIFTGYGIDAYKWLGFVFILFFMVWYLNLFNFMDGIDGIAASETLFLCAAGGVYSLLMGDQGVALLLALLAAATLGFLYWNWPPAKIFMGDVGSGFLGLILVILIFSSIMKNINGTWAWLILIALFMVDATATLIRRILHKERWYSAHRTHAYQWLARRWGHLRTTLFYSGINIVWLLPLSYIALENPDWGAIIMIVAYIPLVILVLLLGAGRKESHV